MNDFLIRIGPGKDVRCGVTVLAFTLFLGLVSPAPTWAQCTEAELQAAVSGGGTTAFTCDGTILLSSTLRVTENTTLDGTGHSVVVSGGGLVRLFTVESGATLTLRNITLIDGRSAQGAAIFITDNASAHLENVVLSNHLALAETNFPSRAGEGGAIYNAGRLVASRCSFLGNSAHGTEGLAGITERNRDGTAGELGAGGFGGALASVGETELAECIFHRNNAVGGAGGHGGEGGSADNVRDNAHAGGRGGDAGAGEGGAIHHQRFALRLLSCTFAENQAIGGLGGDGGRARTAPIGAGARGGAGGFGGSSAGGAIASLVGTLSFTNCTFYTNVAVGGVGGVGGNGSDCRSGRGDGGDGGAGGLGGLAAGGGLFRLTSDAQFGFSTFAYNDAFGGVGGLGGTGGEGCVVAFDGRPGDNGGTNASRGGTIATTAEFPLLRVNASILAFSGTNALNVFGPVRDDQNNLSTDTSFDFGPPNPIDPRLGEFAVQGGFVPTVALLPDSPAINVISDSRQRCPDTDARGVKRGSKCDLGAFEFTPVAVAAVAAGGGLRVEFTALPSTACQLESSEDLMHWNVIADGTSDASGKIIFMLKPESGDQFFRLLMP